MNEVKVREEEYGFVKDIASRLEGLSVPLARRERRLLHDGLLYLTSSGPKIGVMDSKPRSASYSGRRDQSAHTSRPVHLQAYVFTDLIILATPSTPARRGQRQDEERWCLLEKAGLSRILGVTEHRVKAGESLRYLMLASTLRD